MEDLLKTQNQISHAIEQLLIKFETDDPDRKTAQFIRRRLDTLNNYWQAYQDNHIKLSACENKDYTYFSENHYEKTAALYQEARKTFSSCIIQVEQKPILKPATPLGGLTMDWNQLAQQIQAPATPTAATSASASGSGQHTTQPENNQEDQRFITKADFENLMATYDSKKGYSSDNVERGNLSKLDEMYRKQQSNRKAFTRAVSVLNLEILTEKWELEDALKTIQTRWAAVDSLHWEIDSELTREDPTNDKLYYACETKYNDIKKSINSKIWSVSHREKATPTMEIPTFSGNYHQWTSFKDLFTESIHKNKSISNAQKMQFLKSKVKGEAEKLIQHLQISSENYNICWEILNHRYNNKRLLFSSHMNILLGLPVMQQQSASAIKKLHDTTMECLNAIKNLDIDISTWDPLIVHLLTQKLDAETHNDYFEYLDDPRELPSLSEFFNFLEMRFTALESSRRKQDAPIKTSQQQQDFNKKSLPYKYNQGALNKAFINHTNTKTFHAATRKCPLCDKSHGLFHCNTFIEMRPEVKRKTVAKYNLCENCLFDHKNKNCFSEKRCQQCKGRHNTLLHDAFVSNDNKSASTSNEGHGTRKHATHVAQEQVGEILLATAQIKVLSADGSYITMRALIDQGSQTSLISENAAQRLGLPRQNCKGVIFGIGSQENNCKGTMTITASAIYNEYTFSADVMILKSLVNNLPHRSFSKPSWAHLEGIQLADPEFNISRPIDILFGADIYSNIVLNGIIRKDETQPIAQQTRLGWILCGNMRSYQCNIVLHNLDDISRFWAIEDIADDSLNMSSEDNYCLQQFKTETRRQEDGRYVVRLPLRPDINDKLGESKQKAVAQFHQLERKLSKNENVAKDYKSFMSEYIDLGHMKPSNGNKTPSCYLPHHCVQRAESTTTALRVVFNASSKTTSGYSLNDLMYSGPNLQADLLSLILRWRQYKIAFTADIEKMFRQILCHEDDQQYQKIIWRESANQAMREYALTTVTYGTKAAPFLAMMTLKQLAKDEGHQYPVAAKILEQDFYMDDLLSGAHSHSAAKQIQADLINLLKTGRFNLRKWCSNDNDLLEEASKANNNQQAFDFKHQESTKTLGLRWNPHDDVFTFQLKINTSSEKPATKRSLLSDISTIFDPLGWLCPVTTKLKLLFQSVWQQNLKWDDQLPEPIFNDWSKIKQDLVEINALQVQRWLQSHEKDNVELHGYCDASENAYACVIYSKIKPKNQDGDHSASVVIIAAKSRLVPAKKSISLPRLELCAALLLSKLMRTVQQSLTGHNIKTYGWSDSTAVLGWIQGDIGRWKPFVANRVQKIKDTMPPDCWRYVKSADNPADCASRGITASQLRTHDLWWQGPAWLPMFQEESEKKHTYQTDQEIKASLQTNVATQRHNSDVLDDLIKKYSCLTRATRVLAWVLRAISNNKQSPSYLTVPEIRKAKNIIIKHVQYSSFPEEIDSLQQNGKVKSNSKLLPLNPFLDQNGMLRVGGRLNNANISQAMKHPLIIPHSDHLTDMLIDHAHKMTFHGGARLTMSFLRQQFWIIGGNRAVKKHLHACIKCRKHNPIKQNQIMGDLPPARCNPTRPFYHTGVDYTGFIEMKTNKGRGIKTTKGYVAVFVCMVTEAVHLEAVSDLSSSAFLAALRRLSARRGAPRHMYSDNGTNFVGANKQLRQEFIDLKNTLDEEFFAAASEMEIEWHFNAPSWPSAGGLWEAAVKSLKYHLRRVIGEQKLTYEELSTLLAQLEACLNARPLCAISEDPEDIDFLTPSHFLASGPNLTILETERDERTRWQLVQKIYADTWKRWQSEYLCKLSNRSKWQKTRDNVSIGDIVIIHDINLPPGKWAMGRVIELHPGKDGYVRVVSIKTKTGTMKRPITKISKLLTSQTIDSEHAEQQNTQSDQISSSNRTRRTRSNRCYNLITMALMFIITLISPAQCEYSLKSLNNNHSIYFDKLSYMHLVRDEWKLIVYYDMEPYWQGLELYKKYIQNIQTVCSQATKQSRCDVVLLQLRHGFSELEYYNNMMLGQQVPQSRRRRGLINGVGYLAHSLFGVLDEQFAEQYQKDINLLRDNQKHLALLWKNQTSIVEAEYNLLRRVEEAMNKQHKIFNQHIINLEKANNNLAKHIEDVEITNEFSLSSIIANSILVNLKNIQETLLDTITNVHYGKFNIHLLTPEQLRNELNIISGQITKDLALPINNIQTNLQSIYHLLKVKARMTKQYFIFEIKVPLINRDSFEIYKLIAVLQQSREDNMVSIKPIANHLAINIQKDSYIPMSENEIQGCTQYDIDTLLCPLQKPIFQMESDDSLCIKNHVSQQCETELFPCSDTWTELRKPNTYLYFCCSERTIKIICEHQVTAKQISKAGIITLGSGCVIKGDRFTIYAHKQSISKVNISPDIIKVEIPPINNIINLSIPIVDTSTKSEPSDLQKHIGHVGKQIEQLKASEINTVLADRITSHDVHQYVVLYLLTGAAIVSAVLYVWRRMRLRCSERLPAAPTSQASRSDSVLFVSNNARQTERTERPQPTDGATSAAASARALNKATSPILFHRFSE